MILPGLGLTGCRILTNIYWLSCGTCAPLSSEQVRYEQEREWLEGLAKNVEVGMWRAFARTSRYQPLVEM